MIFSSYNPYAPPRTTPPHAGDLPDVLLEVFRAAADVRATHLSAVEKRLTMRGNPACGIVGGMQRQGDLVAGTKY